MRPRVKEPMMKPLHPTFQHLDRRGAGQRHRVPLLLVHHGVLVSPRERDLRQSGLVAVQDLLQGHEIRPFLDDPRRRLVQLRPMIEEVIRVPVNDLDGLGRRPLARLRQEHEGDEHHQPTARTSFRESMHAASVGG